MLQRSCLYASRRSCEGRYALFAAIGIPRERLPRDPSGKTQTSVWRLDRATASGMPGSRHNDRLCRSSKPHQCCCANLGNVDSRPVLILWAVVPYVTKYATKAPKGLRHWNHRPDRIRRSLKCASMSLRHEGSDLLRRSIQTSFARALGERDYHAYEAVQLGLQPASRHPEQCLSSDLELDRYRSILPARWHAHLKGPDERRQASRTMIAMSRNSINGTEW